jgi:hypothetical protein
MLNKYLKASLTLAVMLFPNVIFAADKVAISGTWVNDPKAPVQIIGLTKTAADCRNYSCKTSRTKLLRVSKSNGA